MTNMIENEDSHVEAMDDLNIASLRQVAKYLGIQAQRSWGKEDFVSAIKQKQANSNMASLVFDNANAPKPGYARIVIHRDPTPGHNNTPIHVGVNGRMFQVPRGIEVDLPKEYVEALNNAKDINIREMGATKENPGGSYKEDSQASYPFQVLAITPGDAFENKSDSRATTYKVRKSFFDKFGQWPTDAELKDYKKTTYNK